MVTITYEGPRNAGLRGSMGPSAYIRQEDVHVLLVTKREQPSGSGFARTMGLDPQQMRYIGIKSSTHFRTSFESWAGAIHTVSEHSVHNPAAGSLPFHNLDRQVYPFNPI